MDQPLISEDRRKDGSTSCPRAVVLVLAGLVVVGYCCHFVHWQLIVDDAYILFRYVDNLVSGHGLVYNPGERVEGHSSPLWVLLLAAPAALGASPEETAVVLGFLCGLATLWVVWHLCRRHLGLDPVLTAAACALLAANGSWVFWAAGGLESSLFALLLLLLWWRMAAPRLAAPQLAAPPAAGSRFRRWSALFLLGFLTAACRPEGLALFPALLLLGVAEGRDDLKALAAASLVFLVPAGALLAWRLAYYGQLLPNTFYAKVEPSGSALLRGLQYTGTFLVDDGWLALLPLLAIGCTCSFGRRRFLHPAGVVLAYLAFILAVGGDGLYRHRFFAHLAPLLVLLVAVGLHRVAAIHRRAALALALWCCVVLLVPTLGDDFYAGRPLPHFRRSEQRWQQIGRRLDAVAPAELTIASNVAGKVAYFSRRRTIDMLGLCDPTVARAEAAHGTSYAGHDRAAPEYLLSRRPDLIYLSVLDPIPAPACADAGWLRERLARSALYRYVPLLDSAQLQEHYRPALLRLDRDSWANLLARHDGAATAIPAESLMVLEWQGR